jgi:hypothetical protein
MVMNGWRWALVGARSQGSKGGMQGEMKRDGVQEEEQQQAQEYM